jgi:hypothetical protein
MMPKLIVKSSEPVPRAIELKPGMNRFGRSQGNDDLLNDPAISEQHCEILVEDSFVLVRDLNSTNGTYIEQQRILESELYSGQTLRIGPVEMILEMPSVRVALPELPPIVRPESPILIQLADGYPSCLNHEMRHAVWDCTYCGRVYCNDCVRKLRRVGGIFLRLCPACSNSCRLSAWSEMVKARKRSLIARLADKVKSSFKRTGQLLAKTVRLPPRNGQNGQPRDD